MSTWVKWFLGILPAFDTLLLALVAFVDNVPTGLTVTLHVSSAVLAVVVVNVDLVRERKAEKRERENELAPGREALIGHFRPRAAGFEGQEAAIAHLVRWLVEDGAGVRVVTGGPGSGKSAVLGRIVVLSDPETRSEILEQEPQLPEEQRRVPEGTATQTLFTAVV